MIEKNVKQLMSYNLRELMSRSTVDEVDGKIICYLNLLLDKTSGEILNLSSKVHWTENTISVPIALTTKNLFPMDSAIYLEPAYEDNELPPDVKIIVEQSLQSFNTAAAK